MSKLPGITGERAGHKVAGIFINEEAARVAAVGLENAMGIGPDRIERLVPEAESPGRQLEPESHGIWKTMIRSHVWLAAIGALVGGLVFAVMRAADIAFVVANPNWSLGLLVFFCAVGGGLLAGALTLRPDHTPYLLKTREAIEAGHHVLAIHAVSKAEMKTIEEALQERGARTVTSL